MEVFSGKQVVTGKTAVREGQLLVSGLSETEAGKLSYLHARASAIAEIELRKSYTVNFDAFDYVETGESEKRYAVSAFGKRLPLYRKQSLPAQPYTLKQTRKPFMMFGWKLPFWREQEVYTLYRKKTSGLTLMDAKAILEQRFAEYEIYELADTAILEKNFVMRQKGKLVTMEGTYRVQRDIAREIPIEVLQDERGESASL